MPQQGPARARQVLVVMLVSALLASSAGSNADLRISPDVERAIDRGLEFLARTQRPDGSWPDNYGRNSGVVGLAMMSFLARGEMPDGRYGQVIRRAVDFIIKNQQSNGLLSGPDGSPMYSHGFATLALAEVYGQLDDPRIGPALKKAVGLTLSAQNGRGAWRYSVGSTDADTTVSAGQMIALRAAASAGIEVPTEHLRRAIAFYRTCYSPGGGFGYTGPDGPNGARSGLGLLVFALCGEYRSKEAAETAEWLYRNVLQGSESGYGGIWSYYGDYYVSQAMYQAGGKYWRAWNDAGVPAVLRKQASDGSWGDGGEGKTCSTAFAILSIAINHNLLPIYQR